MFTRYWGWARGGTKRYLGTPGNRVSVEGGRTATPPPINGRRLVPKDASEVNDGNVKETSVAVGHGILNPVFRSSRGGKLDSSDLSDASADC